MNLLDPISLLAIISGIGGAAALWALHHLRVQPPSRKVATLMFWREATRQQQTRVLWGRFTHPRTFLLLTLIALLLAASLVADRWGAGRGAQPAVLVMDTGYVMAAADAAAGSRLERAIELASADAAAIGDDVALIAAGEQPRVLVQRGQPGALARHELRGLSAGAMPAAASSALRLASDLLPSDRGTILWYTAQPELPPDLPPSVAERVRIRRAGEDGPNAAIVGAVFEPATDPLTGRLRVRIARGGGLRSDVAVTATPPSGAALTSQIEAGSDETLLEPMSADGGTWTLQLSGGAGGPLPGPTADDRVTVRLPRRTPLRFAIGDDVAAPVRAALLAVGVAAPAPDGGTIAVLGPRDPLPPAAIGIIRLVEGSGVPSGTPLAVDPSQFDLADLKLEGAAAAEGAALVAGSGLEPVLRGGEWIVAGLTRSGEVVTLQLSSVLWADGAELPRRAAFPVLLQRLSQRLAGWTDAPPAVPAGRTVADPLWPAPDARTGPTVLFDRPTAAPATQAPDAEGAPPAAGGWGLKPFEFVLLAALGMLVGEGLLFAARKIV